MGRVRTWTEPSSRPPSLAAKNSQDVSCFDCFLQQGTVDGTIALSKFGRHAWDWVNRFNRPRDNGYELHDTDQGIEVHLQERTVWGITADELLG